MIKVYQIDNQKFFEKNKTSSLMYDPDYPQFNNTTVLNAFKNGEYIHVADLDVDTLDEAFEVGNIGPEEKYTRYERMHSVSVGDVLNGEINHLTEKNVSSIKIIEKLIK